MRDDNNWMFVAVACLGSFLIAVAMSYLITQSELHPYMRLKEELEIIKDSLAIQHNHFHITVEKDTIITQKVCIDLSSLSQ